jgi:hypothetical protein
VDVVDVDVVDVDVVDVVDVDDVDVVEDGAAAPSSSAQAPTMASKATASQGASRVRSDRVIRIASRLPDPPAGDLDRHDANPDVACVSDSPRPKVGCRECHWIIIRHHVARTFDEDAPTCVVRQVHLIDFEGHRSASRRDARLVAGGGTEHDAAIDVTEVHGQDDRLTSDDHGDAAESSLLEQLLALEERHELDAHAIDGHWR